MQRREEDTIAVTRIHAYSSDTLSYQCLQQEMKLLLQGGLVVAEGFDEARR
jgi:hypothetical protein